MDFKTFYSILVKTRMINGRLTKSSLLRFLKSHVWDFSTKPKMNIKFDKQQVFHQLYLARIHAHHQHIGPAIANFSKKAESSKVNIRIEDVKDPSIAQEANQDVEQFQDPNITEYFLHKYSKLIDENMGIEEANPPLLFSDFVNCLLMAVHVKSGSIKRLSTYLGNYMKKRFHPILDKEIRPKVLIGDESVILRRGKAVLSMGEEKWRNMLKGVWNTLQSRKSPISGLGEENSKVSILKN